MYVYKCKALVFLVSRYLSIYLKVFTKDLMLQEAIT